MWSGLLIIKETWKEMIRDKPELATKFTQKKKKKGKTNAVKVIPIDQIGPPVITPWGVHIVWRTG